MFAGLVSYEADGSTVNEVAKSFESDDDLTWTIEIEDGWEFTNGEPVIADSFVDAWKEGAYRLNSYFFESIEGWDDEAESELTGLEVVDDHTFTVTLTEPTPDFPLHLGYSARSEERRVGKECGARGPREHEKRNSYEQTVVTSG